MKTCCDAYIVPRTVTGEWKLALAASSCVRCALCALYSIPTYDTKMVSLLFCKAAIYRCVYTLLYMYELNTPRYSMFLGTYLLQGM